MPNQDVVLCQDTVGFRAHGLRADKAEVALCKKSPVPEAQGFELAVGLQ